MGRIAEDGDDGGVRRAARKRWAPAAVCFWLLVVIAARSARAAPGDASLQFLRLDSGPREIGMGGAGTAVGGDAYSFVYNPALLALEESRELAFSHAQWLQDIQFQDVVYVHPSLRGNLGVRFQRLSYGSIDTYDATGSRTGTTAPSDLLAGLTYARQLRAEGLSWGAGVKAARETLAGVSGQTYLFDLGAAFTPQAPGWLGETTFGLALRNLGLPVRFDTEKAPVPSELSLGLSANLYSECLLLAADAHVPKNQSPHGNLGVELWGLDVLALRAGFELPQDQGIGIRAGLGFRVRNINVDYAFFPLDTLGQTHHFSLRFVFGGPADAVYEQGLRFMRQSKYPEAILKFNETLKLNPKHWRAVRKLRRAYELMQQEEKQ